MHMERLRKIKPTVDMKKPPKPTHISKNYKKELQNMERLSEIQYQNRVLLRKMLQIDMKPSHNTTKKKQLARNNSAAIRSQGTSYRPTSAKYSNNNENQGLNSYNSLNRANRIRSLAKIIDENKVLLDKLQNTRSTYSMATWKNEYVK